MKYSKNEKQSTLLLDVITKPRWKHRESGKVHSANKILIPDIVTIKVDKLSIYDTKYYKIKLEEQGLISNQVLMM